MLLGEARRDDPVRRSVTRPPAEGRKLRVEQASPERRRHARAVVMREARGPAWTDWLVEHGLVGLSGWTPGR